MQGGIILIYKTYVMEDAAGIVEGLKAVRDDFGLSGMTDEFIESVSAISYDSDSTKDTVVFSLGDFSFLLGGGESHLLKITKNGVFFD